MAGEGMCGGKAAWGKPCGGGQKEGPQPLGGRRPRVGRTASTRRCQPGHTPAAGPPAARRRHAALQDGRGPAPHHSARPAPLRSGRARLRLVRQVAHRLAVGGVERAAEAAQHAAHRARHRRLHDDLKAGRERVGWAGTGGTGVRGQAGGRARHGRLHDDLLRLQGVRGVGEGGTGACGLGAADGWPRPAAPRRPAARRAPRAAPGR